jgi:hypothetical protein
VSGKFVVVCRICIHRSASLCDAGRRVKTES